MQKRNLAVIIPVNTAIIFRSLAAGESLRIVAREISPVAHDTLVRQAVNLEIYGTAINNYRICLLGRNIYSLCNRRE